MSYTDKLFDIQGQVAVITGAGGYLCSAMAIGLASAGAKIAVLDLRLDKAQSVADDIINSGGKAIARAITVANKEQNIESLQTIFVRFGSEDRQVNGAGTNYPTPLFDINSNVKSL